MEYIIQEVLRLVADMGYLGIFIMMTIESSFFPFPSEIAMIPAGALSSQGEMNFAIAFFVGTGGAMVGASVNYLLGWKLGAPLIKKLIEKYGKYIFLSLEHYNKTEYFFLDHGVAATFLGRLVTGIRQIISIPAGVFKMNYYQFLMYTAVGAGLWNLILMVIGYLAVENQELVQKYSFTVFIGSFIIVGISSYLYFQRRKYPHTDKTSGLLLFNQEGKLLIQEKKNNSKYGEKWSLFSSHIEYGEKPRETAVRTIQDNLTIDTEDTAIYLGSMQVKIPLKHVIVKRNYFYDTTKNKIEEIRFKEGITGKFVSLEELETLEGFYVTGGALKKLIFLAKKALHKIEKKRKENEKNMI